MCPESRIALLGGSLRGGGAEKVLVILANGLADRGILVDLVLGRAHGPYMKDIADTVNVVNLGTSTPAVGLFRLAAYLLRERPESIISSSVMCNVAAVLSRMLTGVKSRLVLREDCLLSLSSPLINTSGTAITSIPRFAFRLVPYTYKRADIVVGVSKGVVEDLVERFGVQRERTRAIYNPVITPDLEMKKRELPDHVWFDDNVPIILAVGRLEPEKDIATLLRAFALLRSETDTRLIILGEGTQRDLLMRQVGALGLTGNVDMPGFVDNPYAYMQRAALYVLSSVREGMSNTIVEALACGCPVVSTDCPSGPAEILDHGRYGFLSPVGDEVKLAGAMRRALDEPAPRAASAWLEKFRVDYALDRHLEAMHGA